MTEISLRLVGGMMIAAASAYGGLSRADALKKRRDFLTYFSATLAAMETEISFEKKCLGDIFSALEKRGGNNEFYAICAANTPTIGAAAAWKKAADAAAAKEYLTAADSDTIKQLGDGLGMSDAQGQIRAIRHTYTELARHRADAENRYRELGKVYRQCGFLAGAAVILLTL